MSYVHSPTNRIVYRDFNHLPKGAVQIVGMHPNDLPVTINALHMGIKYHFARAWNLGDDCPPNRWPCDMYTKSIVQLNGGHETPEYKPNVSEFRTEFLRLLESMQSCGFRSGSGMVATAWDGSLLSGAHRIVAATVLNKCVLVREDKRCHPHDDHKARYSQDVLDAMAVGHVMMVGGVGLLCAIWRKRTPSSRPGLVQKQIVLTAAAADDLDLPMRGRVTVAIGYQGAPSDAWVTRSPARVLRLTQTLFNPNMPLRERVPTSVVLAANKLSAQIDAKHHDLVAIHLPSLRHTCHCSINDLIVGAKFDRRSEDDVSILDPRRHLYVGAIKILLY